MKKRLVPIILAHLLASGLAAVLALFVAQFIMVLHLSPGRMVMGVIFAPVLAPVSVVIVTVGVLVRHNAPPLHFTTMAIAYMVAFVLGLNIGRRAKLWRGFI